MLNHTISFQTSKLGSYYDGINDFFFISKTKEMASTLFILAWPWRSFGIRDEGRGVEEEKFMLDFIREVKSCQVSQSVSHSLLELLLLRADQKSGQSSLARKGRKEQVQISICASCYDPRGIDSLIRMANFEIKKNIQEKK